MNSGSCSAVQLAVVDARKKKRSGVSSLNAVKGSAMVGGCWVCAHCQTLVRRMEAMRVEQ